MRARRTLDSAAAIYIAMMGQPEEVGEVRILAGDNPKEVSRWVLEQRIARREQEVQARQGKHA